MSDIPVGSPPVPPGRHAAPSGWYPDPVDPAQERYWDGWQWSRNTRLRDLGGGSTPARSAPQTAGPAPYGAAPGSYPPQTLRPGQVGGPLSADGVPLAGWGRRAWAAILDTMISYFLASLLLTPLYAPLSPAVADWINASMAAQRTGDPAPALPVVGDFLSTRDQLLAALILFVVLLGYHVLFLRWKAATPGKMALGIRVAPVDHGLAAARLSWRMATIRSALWVLPRLLGYLPSTVGLFFALRLADVLVPLRHRKRQSLHDMAARTQVVRSR